MSDLVPLRAAADLAAMDAAAPRRSHLSPEALAKLVDSVAPETLRAYRREWAKFAAWCERSGHPVLPCTHDTLTNWVAARIDLGHGLTAVKQGISAVRFFHEAEGGMKDWPDASDAWKLVVAYQRELLDSGWRPAKAATFDPEEFRAMVGSIPLTTAGLRDRAVLGVALGSMFRRSNIVRLDVGDVTRLRNGEIMLHATRSKTDQAGRGRDVVLPVGDFPLSSPADLLVAWIDALGRHGVTDGPLFRRVSKPGRVLPYRLSPEWVGTIVKRAANAAGLVSARGRVYRAHSTRSSAVTIARAAGRSWDVIRAQGGWAQDSDVVYGYEQPEDEDHAMRGVGL